MLNICTQSMYITGTVAEWERWTGQRYPGTGRYVVPGALNPILIDKEKDIGSYTEPNVWLSYRLTRTQEQDG